MASVSRGGREAQQPPGGAIGLTAHAPAPRGALGPGRQPYVPRPNRPPVALLVSRSSVLNTPFIPTHIRLERLQLLTILDRRSCRLHERR
jgi:hypothetical protein